MRRSLTAYVKEESDRRPQARRAATSSATLAVGAVEKGLEMINLEEIKEVSLSDMQLKPLVDVSDDGRAISNSLGAGLEAQPEEGNGEEEVSTIMTPETSLDEIPMSDGVHQSLKDLIYRTNKQLYDVDSNKVKYKAGLSRKGLSVPSLHHKKEAKSSDS